VCVCGVKEEGGEEGERKRFSMGNFAGDEQLLSLSHSFLSLSSLTALLLVLLLTFSPGVVCPPAFPCLCGVN